MLNTLQNPHIWQQSMLSSVVAITEAEDGDFTAIERSRFWMALLTKNLLKASIYNIEAADGYMTALTTGWMMGKAAHPLFGVDWITLWEMPIDRVRASLNITVNFVES